MTNQKTPFSFNELNKDPILNICNPDFLEMTDDSKIAYYKYESISPTKRILLFVHGGGAYSGAGYQYVANGLSQRYETTVILVDIRGHGASDGARGDSPSKTRIWSDISEVLQLINGKYPTIPVFLGGHSSGGGLVLNYATWKKRVSVSGYLLLSPKLGYKSNADRYKLGKDPFATIYFISVLVNKISFGLFCGHSVAVTIQYPDSVKEQNPLLVDTYTCNTVNAITPHNLKKQFSQIDKPICLFIGSNDELFNPENTIAYCKFAKESFSEIVAGAKHLSILRIADELFGQYFNGGTLRTE